MGGVEREERERERRHPGHGVDLCFIEKRKCRVSCSISCGPCISPRVRSRGPQVRCRGPQVRCRGPQTHSRSGPHIYPHTHICDANYAHYTHAALSTGNAWPALIQDRKLEIGISDIASNSIHPVNTCRKYAQPCSGAKIYADLVCLVPWYLKSVSPRHYR
jgi:hypothetical protein